MFFFFNNNLSFKPDVMEVEELDDTERGAGFDRVFKFFKFIFFLHRFLQGGFGSTGVAAKVEG